MFYTILFWVGVIATGVCLLTLVWLVLINLGVIEPDQIEEEEENSFKETCYGLVIMIAASALLSFWAAGKNGPQEVHDSESVVSGSSNNSISSDAFCSEVRDDFVAMFAKEGVPRREAEAVWYDNQLRMKFSDTDCEDFARGQLKK